MTYVEERVVFGALKTANETQRQQLVAFIIAENSAFVKQCLRQWSTGADTDDLLQAGLCGLLEAINGFDVDRGYKFITYAVWWIKNKMRQEVELTNIIRIPTNKLQDLQTINDAADKLSQEQGRQPSWWQTYQRSDMNMNEFLTTLLPPRTIMLDQLLFQDNPKGMSVGDIIPDVNVQPQDEGAHNEQLRRLVREQLENIPQREATVLSLYYGLDGPAMTLQQIGQKLHVTRERVRQLRNNGLEFMREDMGFSPLSELRQETTVESFGQGGW